MGESSAPRRPTHDTNTSRRQVHTHTHTHHQQHQQQQHIIKAKQIQTHYEDYWIDCIYFDASCCCYGFNSFCKVHCISRTSKICCNAISAQCEACKAGVSVEEICRTWVVDSSDPLSSHSRPLDGCPQNQPKPCCRANTLECQACIADVSEEEFCRRDPHSHVCPQKPDNMPSHPDNCYSSIWNTEIRHGEMGAKKCCWYGKWEKKSKCEKNPPVTHPDNCYSSIWNTEIRHGEMGAKKCCWYGDWKRKSKCEKKSPVTHPDNCYSSIWNTEIRHGEMGAKKCCWYGDWKRKSKCNGGHKDD